MVTLLTVPTLPRTYLATQLTVGKRRVSVDALVNLKKKRGVNNYCTSTTTLFQRLCAQRMAYRESLKHTVLLRDTPK